MNVVRRSRLWVPCWLAAVGWLGCGAEVEPAAPEPGSVPIAAATEEAAAPAAADRLASLRARQTELQRRIAQDPKGVAARIEAADRELREELADPDPEVRAHAASFVDLELADSRQRVIELAHKDPDAQVRIAAVEALAFDGQLLSVVSLLPALGDADSEVVMAAIEGLEDAADESVLPELERLYEHPDPAVQERAREAVDYLR